MTAPASEVVLITGGMGFIGLHTAKQLADAGHRVVLTRYRVRREPDFIAEHLGRGVTVETADVSDPYRVFDVMARHKVDSVVHLVVPALGVMNPAEETRVNVTGLLNVLEAARVTGVRRVCLASSIAVYAGLGEIPWREDAPLPVTSANPTCAFKKTWEILAHHFADRASMDVIALRIGGVYGPLYHSMANLPSRLAHAAVRGRPLGFTPGAAGAPAEDQGSDLCYVKDCARAIRLLHFAPSLAERVYNIGGGHFTCNQELAAAVASAAGGPAVQLGPRQGAKPAYMDTSRIRSELGYEPGYTIESGVADYVAWLREHEQ
jgi:UDP-glucose 4-epimerase